MRRGRGCTAGLWLSGGCLLAACAAVAQGEDVLRVGSKRFTESYILGEVVTQTVLRAGEAKALHSPGLGNTGIVYAALQTGSIDIYPEYTGTIAREILKDESLRTLQEINARLKPLGLAAGSALGFNNTYALALRDADAARLGIVKLSDLAAHPDLKFGLSNEFLGRSDGWRGLQQAYGLGAFRPTGIDHGLAFDAVAAHQIDITDIYSTDAKIERFELRVLQDDRSYFPAYDAVLLYRLEVPQRFPKSWAALQQLEQRIDAKTMTHLNAQAELAGHAFAEVAAGFLRSAPAIATRSAPATAITPAASKGFLAALFADDFARLTREHIGLVLISLLVATLLGIPTGIYAARHAAAAQAILATVGVIQTIPALALLAFLIPLLHRIGTVPTLVALFLYALLPIVRNTYVGLISIAPSLTESAHALGLSASARLRRVELPLAAPTILAGIRTSAIINVGTASIAAFIGAGGYGERIATGLALNDHMTLLAGAVPTALLALLVDALFYGAERWMVPRGLRSQGQARV